MNGNEKTLYRQLSVMALIAPLIRNSIVIITIAGITSLILRINNIHIPLPYIFSFPAIIISTSAITIILNRKKLPTRNQVISMLDNNGRYGGLLMAQNLEGSKKWAIPTNTQPLNVSWNNPPLLITFFIATLFLILSIYIPIPESTESSGKLQLGKTLTRIEEQIDTMESLDILEKERAELFRKELNALEKENNAENPAASWETIDQLNENLIAKANEAIEEIQNKLTEQSALNEMTDAIVEMWKETGQESDIAYLAAMELADLLYNNTVSPELTNLIKQTLPKISGSNSLNSISLSKEDMKKLSNAINGLSAEELAKLRELFEQGLMDSTQMQSCQNIQILTADELREMLRQQCKKAGTGSCTNLNQCISATMLCQNAEMCSGMSGTGGVNRGPGNAKLNFSGNTEENGFLFKLQSLPKGSPQFNKSKLVGISASSPQVNRDSSKSRGGAIKTQNGENATTISTSLLPQHRKVVQNYFSRKTLKKDRNNT